MVTDLESLLDAAGGRFRAYEDAEALALDASCQVVDHIREAFRRRRRAALALAGGRTPFRIYEHLSRWPLRWEWVDIVPTSERWVSRLSLERNATLLRHKLLRHEATAANYLPLVDPWEDDPGHAELVRATARANATVAKLRGLDVVLLGMGLDGHVASLFPNNPANRVTLDPNAEQSCILTPPNKSGPLQPRISLSLAEIAKARRVLVVIRGERKREALAEALRSQGAPIAALLRHHPQTVDVLWSP